MSESLPAMTGAEMQATREYLGLTLAWLAEKFSLNERRLHRMEADRDRIPDFLVKYFDESAAYTDQLVSDLIAEYRRRVKGADGTVFFKVFRKDDAYDEASNDVPGVNHNFPAKWHRIVGARVAEGAPGLILSYWDVDQAPVLPGPRVAFSG